MLQEKPLSANKVAKVIGVSPHTVNKIIDENKDRIYVGGSDAKRLVFASQISHVLMKLPGEMPDPIGGVDVSNVELLEDDDEIEPVDEFVFQIFRDGKKIDSWERIPMDDELRDAFGPGSYVIVKKNVDTNLTSHTIRINVDQPSDADKRSPIERQIEDLANVQKFTSAILGDGQKQGPEAMMMAMMREQLAELRRQNQFFLEMVLKTSAGGNGAGGLRLASLRDEIEAIQGMRDLFGDSQGGAGGNLTEKLVEALIHVAPAIAEKLGIGGGAAAPIGAIPKTVESSPQPAIQPVFVPQQSIQAAPHRAPATISPTVDAKHSSAEKSNICEIKAI